jgi:hypothetical protein
MSAHLGEISGAIPISFEIPAGHETISTGSFHRILGLSTFRNKDDLEMSIFRACSAGATVPILTSVRWWALMKKPEPLIQSVGAGATSDALALSSPRGGGTRVYINGK